MDQVWGIFVPAWIAALSVLLGLVAAPVAAVFAWRALRGALERDERATAYGLSAWWVGGEVDGNDQWGVILSNSSSAVSQDVNVLTRGNKHPFGEKPITIRTAPPGHYFVRSMPRANPYSWGPHASVRDLEQFNPLTATEEWSVSEMTFTDLAARR